MQRKQIILFVEDEQQQRESLAMMLEVEGYQVIATESAEQALEHIETTSPDMIVTDVKLPGMDGFALFDRVRDFTQLYRMPFLFITGYNDPKAIERVKRLGAAAYITKPYDLENLLSVIKQLLPLDSKLPQ